MAERTLTVQLRALVQGYTGPMAKAALAGGPVEKSLARVQRAGTAMTRVGDTLTTRVSLPLAAVGAVAIKMAVDFDAAMSKIVGLVGISREEVDGMKESVLKLSGETTKSPQELADALFTITSAGLRGAEAMDVLEMSAKASAAGLGDTRAIAEAVTASINTYGSEVLTAAEATDIFVGTARAGNFATEELTGSMGRVLPFAKQAGASLEDIGGGVALLTRSNNDANESITQMTALFRAFVKPTATAVGLLDELDLSAADVRDSIAEKGLAGALQGLNERLLEHTGSADGAKEAWGKLVEDGSALGGVFQILDADAETLDGTFGAVADSAGLTDDAFSAFEESAGFKGRQAVAQLQAAMIELGDVLIPVASSIAGFAASLVSAFSALPGPVKSSAVWVGVFVAALGPLLSIGGRLVTTYGKVMSALMNFAVPANTVSRSLGDTKIASRGLTGATGGLISKLGPGLGLVGVLAVAAVALDGFARQKREAKEQAKTFADAIREEGDAISGLTKLLAGDSNDALNKIRGTAQDFGLELEVLRDAIAGDRDALTGFNDSMAQTGSNLNSDVVPGLRDAAAGGDELAAELLKVAEGSGSYNDTVRNLVRDLLEQNELLDRGDKEAGDLAEAEEELTGKSSELAAEMEAVGLSAEEMGTEFESLTEAVEAHNDALNAMFDPLFGMVDAVSGNAEALRAVKEAEDAAAEAVKEHGEKSDEAREAERALERAHIDSAKSAMDLEIAAFTLAGAIEAGEVSLEDAKAALERWRERGDISRETARRLGRAFEASARDADDQTGALNRMPSKKTITFNTNAAAAKIAIGGVSGALDALPARKFIDVIVRETITGGMTGGVTGRQHGGPFAGGQLMLVGEAGPELALFDSPGRIMANHDPLTRAALAGARPASGGAVMAGGGRVDLSMRITGNGALARMVHEGFRSGDIQVQANGHRVAVG